MRLLRGFLGFINVRFRREIILAELVLNVEPRFLDRGERHLYRVGPHISYESYSAFGPDIEALIQLLRYPHRLAGPEVQLIESLLLHLRSRERRLRVWLLLGFLYILYFIFCS